MNIEELSKSQLLLLTILVNFVTAVATGIITVSLVDQAPPFVTQTVNRVVEHTIETVTQAAPAAVVAAPAPSNQDLVTAALAADAARVVGIYDLATGTSSPALAVGTFLPKARAVASVNVEGLPQEALIGFPGGSFIPASLARRGEGVAIYGFADSAKLPSAPAPALVAARTLKLGATTLTVAPDGSAATGIVARVGETNIYTTLPEVDAGSAAVDLSGNLLGLIRGTTPGVLVSADAIAALLAATSSATSTQK